MRAMFRRPTARDESAGIDVYDAAGRHLRTLTSQGASGDLSTAEWDGLDASGRPIESGVYFLRLVVDGRQEARQRVVVVR